MKNFVAIAFASFVLIASAPSNGVGQATFSKDDQAHKWICILEKAAGVMYADSGAKEPVGKAVNFDERHKKFVLSIKRIVRSEEERDKCRSSLAHWSPILTEKGKFDPSDEPNFGALGPRTFYDFRANLGPRCFASDEATIKFFDRDQANIYEMKFIKNENCVLVKINSISSFIIRRHNNETNVLIKLGPAHYETPAGTSPRCPDSVGN
jgi:hypothetical protein